MADSKRDEGSHSNGDADEAGSKTAEPLGDLKRLVTADSAPETRTEARRRLLEGDAGSRFAIQGGRHGDPHFFLGPHPAELENEDGESVSGCVVRIFEPRAERAELSTAVAKDAVAKDAGAKDAVAMESIGPGQFAAWCPGLEKTTPYRVRLTAEDGSTWERDDAYRFSITVSEEDLYYFSEGTHLLLWHCLGARPLTCDGVEGWAFTVWAPSAQRVSVIGEFNGWDGRVHSMRRLGMSGMWELFIPELPDGVLYKFEILTADGGLVQRADPMAQWAEVPPNTASRTFRSSYDWQDGAWMDGHAERDVRREPMAVYEVHLGSWLEDPSGEVFTYRELAPKLVEHVRKLGYNYLELLPVAEHPFDGSWGYQITGYFAPTSRYGDPDDFRYFVDYCHQQGIGVIVDWVPAHFVKDAHGLGRFDGSALYEHEDPRRGEHPDWGTYIFNYGRYEVKNFLVANALYWLQELHVDGLRVDAVASMLYLDYSREEGEWLANVHGGRENLEAIALLQEVNRQIKTHFPGRFTVAEESTAWPGITKDVDEGGLGFTLKWNMGWMHDTLNYFSCDPLYRAHQHDQLTFAMVYEYSEAFVNPLSHDEVVHGKGSLLTKMPGDRWRQFANLRALTTYQYTRPGKVLNFMGSELASPREWNHQKGLEWELLDDPSHGAYFQFVQELGALYLGDSSFWHLDHEPDGFQWIACHDRKMSVFSFARWDTPKPEPKAAASSGDSDAPEDLRDTEARRIAARPGEHRVVVLNLTPVPHETYALGMPKAGRYKVLLCSDDGRFGGSGYPRAEAWETVDEPKDGLAQHVVMTLPPLCAMVLAHEPAKTTGAKAKAAKGTTAKKPKKSAKSKKTAG